MLLPLPGNVCAVPRDLSAVTRIRPGAETDPRDLGVAADAPARIWSAVEALYRYGMHPGIAICVRRNGGVLLDRAIGHARGNGPSDARDAEKVPVTPDTPFNVFSAAKAVTAMLIHLLDQRNEIRLDDPICEYIPEYGCHGKELVTIRHLLAHRAGVPNLPPDAMRLDLLPHREEIVKILCATTPATRPGSRLAYHAISAGFLLGEVVHRVTGQDVRTFMDENVRAPLGFRWMRYGVDPDDVDLVAPSYFTGPLPLPPLSTLFQRALGLEYREVVRLSNDPRFLTALVPAGNLVTTADEMSRFYQMLLDGGAQNGIRIFEPRTIRRATTEQSYMEIDLTLGFPFRYGLGFMLGDRWLSVYGPDTTKAFGHVGLTNVITWADPERRVAACILTSGKPIVYFGIYYLWEVMRQIAAVCPKVSTNGTA